MAFAAGDLVHVPGLGTGVFREERGGSRYAIEIKGRLVVAAAADVEPAAEKIRTRKARAPATRREDPPVDDTASRGGSPADGRAARATPAAAAPSLDLHGKTALEAVAALESFLNDALLEGRAEAHVIHGRSGGRVKAAVHQYLRRMPTVAAFRVAPHNPGVTIVLFS